MKDHGGCGCKGSHLLGRGTVTNRPLGCFYPRGKPRYPIYRRLRRPQDQSEHEGVKKNLHPSDTRDRTRAVQPVPKRLVAWATWPFGYIRYHYHHHHHHHHQSVLPKGGCFTANAGNKVAVLTKGRSSIANSGTKVAVLLGINRCGSFPLLSAIYIR